MTSFRLVRRLLLLLAAISVGCGDGGPVGSNKNTTLSKSGERGANAEINAPGRVETAHSILTRSNIARGSDDPFVFPDELPDRMKNEPGVIKGTPACAHGKEFCESIDGYPEGYISNVLTNKLSEFTGMFGGDTNVDQELTIGHKVDPSAEKSLCLSREEEKEIRAAKTIRNEWLYVVNQGNYTQKVRMELCLPSRSGSECSRINLGYKTECKQKFVYQKLIALTKNGDFEVDVFRIPSCCACVLKTDRQSILSRIADPNPTTPAIKTKA